MSVQMRDISANVFNRMNEMKSAHVDHLISQLEKTNSVFSKSDLRDFLRREFEAFSKEVEQEFTEPEAKDFAELFLSAFELQMVGGNQIRNQVIKVLGNKLQ